MFHPSPAVETGPFAALKARKGEIFPARIVKAHFTAFSSIIDCASGDHLDPPALSLLGEEDTHVAGEASRAGQSVLRMPANLGATTMKRAVARRH